MFSRIRVASCLASAAALVGPVIAPTVVAHADVSECAPITLDDQDVACITLSSSTTTDADGDPGLLVTLTVTVDGQTPVTKSESATIPLSQVQSTVNSTVGQYCVANGQQVYTYSSDANSNKEAHEFGIGTRRPDTPMWCLGLLGLTVMELQPSVTPPVLSIGSVQPIYEPYHIPKACLTTTPGICIGPYDGVVNPSVPVPGVTQPTVSGDEIEFCLGGPAGTTSPNDPFEIYDIGNYGYYDDSNCFGD